MKRGFYMNEISHTQYFKTQKAPEVQVKDIIADVYTALTEKGYNPVTVSYTHLTLPTT